MEPASLLRLLVPATGACHMRDTLTTCTLTNNCKAALKGNLRYRLPRLCFEGLPPADGGGCGSFVFAVSLKACLRFAVRN